jgi:hypothetical protein
MMSNGYSEQTHAAARSRRPGRANQIGRRQTLAAATIPRATITPNLAKSPASAAIANMICQSLYLAFVDFMLDLTRRDAFFSMPPPASAALPSGYRLTYRASERGLRGKRTRHP